jgi:hypothetical protein
MIGNNQYFFLINRNVKNSLIKESILKLITHIIIFVIFFNPVRVNLAVLFNVQDIFIKYS